MDENYDKNENGESNESQPPKYDPAGEFKQKIIFMVVAIAILLAVKFLGV
ncbi:MAG: hypothetical protein ACOYXC_18705 [Candidatus Rifleibacteriota bacterium]